MTLFRILCLFVWVGLGWGAPAWAEKADRDKPMHIEADAMRHDEGKRLTQFTGGVVATKGTLVLRGARMDVQQDKEGRQMAQIWAAPQERVFFRQKREGLNEFTEGEAETVIYDSQTDAMTLLHRAELRTLRGTQLADQIHGEKIVFNNTTEVMTVDGQSQPGSSKTGQRVRAVLSPRSPAAPSGVEPNAVIPHLRSSPSVAGSIKP